MTPAVLTIDGQSFEELPANEQAAFNIQRCFDVAEKAWRDGHWMECRQSDVDEINARLAGSARVMPLTASDGRLMLCADLLTDCGPGGTYEPAADLLQGLTIVVWSPSA
ncbi:hypothetical protein [Fimbriimonas ginsengisoli]|uniref:Uncharacterized protein n=1 Tax=Fimbriimonas ginsengisoli Gsoil 348 TaxID=661478 RepID=A0A068NW57_FIMGI|nr:hypothetical protein [Fimbriimonas ginsengisoli]AIE87005.1 hypothetical protein OP10G_3637 [Fimbriimonas ginsengisoli Gsoil 348]